MLQLDKVTQERAVMTLSAPAERWLCGFRHHLFS
jgi:hypothetical protein